MTTKRKMPSRADVEGMRSEIDWSGYNETTTLREAFSVCGLSLAKTETPGFFRAHCLDVTQTTGYPKALYAWLHKNYGCPCDPYWLS